MEVITTKRGSGKGRRAISRQPSSEAEPEISPVITGVSSITTEMFHDASVIGEIRPQTKSSQQKDNIFDMLQETVSLASKSADVSNEDTSATESYSEGAGRKTQIADSISDSSARVSQKTVDSSNSTESLESTSQKGNKIKEKERRKSADAVTDETEHKRKGTKRRLSTSEERDLSESLEHRMSFDEDSSQCIAPVDDNSNPEAEISADLPEVKGLQETAEQPMETESVNYDSNVSSTEKEEEQIITSTSSEVDEGSSNIVKEGVSDAGKCVQQKTVTADETSDSENTVSSTEPNICEGQTKGNDTLETGSKVGNDSNQAMATEKEKPKERNIFEKLSERPLDNTEELSERNISSDATVNVGENKDTEQMDTNESASSSEQNVTDSEEQDLAARFLNKIPAVEKVKDTCTEDNSSDSVSIDLAFKPSHSENENKFETGTEVVSKDSNEQNMQSADKLVSSNEPISYTDVTENSRLTDTTVDKTDTAELIYPVDKSESDVTSAETSEENEKLGKLDTKEQSVTSAEKPEESEISISSAEKSEDNVQSFVFSNKKDEEQSVLSADNPIESGSSDIVSTDTVKSSEIAVTSEEKVQSTSAEAVTSEEQVQSTSAEAVTSEEQVQSTSAEAVTSEEQVQSTSAEAVTSVEKVQSTFGEETGKTTDDSLDEIDTCDIMLLPVSVLQT